MSVDRAAEAPELDVRLLSGFSFTCRPDCGLCCYARPRVRRAEADRLLQIAPATEFVVRGEDRFLASRGDGGACQFLTRDRCRVHAARPSPCREFPVTVHVGHRLQASVVLSCPGLGLEALAGVAHSDPVGFESELAAVRSRLDATTVRRLRESERRGARIARQLQREGRWLDEEEVRRHLRSRLPRPERSDFPVEDPPETDGGLENLPLFFDDRANPVALAAGLGGWERIELDPGGASSRPLGVVAPPDRPPELTPPAAELLNGYLRYWLERDALFGTVLLAMRDSVEGNVRDWVAAELRRIGALTLARADVRARARRGVSAPLDARDLADGIRATDQDLLDRDSWGDRL